MQLHIDDITLECLQGNIVRQDEIEAIVNAANAWLQTGGGVAGAIHQAAGPGLAKECAAQAPIQPGEAVISSAHNLPNRYVIHCLGPVYGKDIPEDQILADCYTNALNIAEQRQIISIAFPAISTGAFGYPIEEATKICRDTVKRIIPELSSLQLIRFVLFSEQDLEVYKNTFQDLS
ncbi:MAG: macro domain-containing protein [Balneolaceae bacterium]|nr:macro domain-containing protein [Balneolaceae bacterium]